MDEKEKEIARDEWNKKVYADSQQSIAKSYEFSPVDFSTNKKVEDTLFKREVAILNSAGDADALDKIGAGWKSFKMNNDFFTFKDYMEKPDDKEDKDWIEYVSKKENAESLASSFEVPSVMLLSEIPETKNYQEFEYIVNKKKRDLTLHQEIQATTSSSFIVGTGAVLGAVAGMDMALMAVPFVGSARLGYKIEKALQASKNVDDIRRVLEKREKVAMVAGLGLSAAIPVIRNEIDDDYSKTDGFVDFFLNVSGGYLFKEWKFAKHETKLSEIEEYFKAREMAEAVIEANVGKSSEWFPTGASEAFVKYGDTSVWTPYGATSDVVLREQRLLLEYSPKLGLPAPKAKDDVIAMGTTRTGKEPIIVGTKGVGTNKSPIELGAMARIEKQIDIMKKELAVASKLLSDTKIGKEKLAKIGDDAARLTDDLKFLETRLVSIKKTKNLEAKFKKIDEASKRFPNAFARDLIPELTPIVEDAFKHIEDLDIDGAFKKQVEGVVKRYGGERIVVKVDADGAKVGVITKNNKFKEIIGNNKLLSAAAVTTLGATAAQADDGSFVQDLPMYALGGFLAIFFGAKVFKAIHNVGIMNAAKNAYDGMASVVVDKNLAVSPTGRYIGKAYAAYNSALIAMGFTFRATYYKSNDAGKTLAKKLFWDPENTTEEVAEFTKEVNLTRNTKIFYDEYRDAFKEYKKTNFKQSSKISTLVNHTHIKKEFNEAITFARENPTAKVDPAVRRMATTFGKLLDDVNERAIALKVAGFKRGKTVADYVPRMTKSTDVFQMITMSDGSWNPAGKAYLALKDNFKRMYEATHPTAVDADLKAEAFMDGILQSKSSTMVSFGDLLGDTVAYAKARIPLDLTLFKNFDITINGEKKTFELSTLFERDAEVIFNHYSNAMEGHIALAKVGITNYTDALAIGATQSDNGVSKIFENSINTLLGKTNYDVSTTLSQSMNSVSNLTPLTGMQLSSVLQIYEAGMIAIRSAKNFKTFMTGITETVNVLKNRGSNDPEVRTLMTLTHMGSSIMTNKLHARLVDDAVSHAETYGKGAMADFEAGTRMAKDVSMIAYLLAPITDIGHRVALKTNMRTLVKVAFGKKELSKILTETYGITDDALARIRALPFNKKGEWTDAVDVALLADPKTADDLGRIVFNMTNSQMLMPTLGGTPNMFRESALGKGLSTLLSFASNSASNYGIRHVKGISTGDVGTMIDIVMWFGAMMIAESLRDAIKGRERTEQELMMAALMQMPITGMVGTISGMSSPAAEMVPEKAAQTVDTIFEVLK